MRTLLFLAVLIVQEGNARLSCFTWLTRRETPQETALAHVPQAPIKRNNVNWEPVLQRFSGRDEAKAKLRASLEAYAPTNTAEFKSLMAFLDSPASEGWKLVAIDREGSNVCDPSTKTVSIFLKNEPQAVNINSKGATQSDSPAHSFFHELWHAKDITEGHPASDFSDTETLNNPINQLSREYRANRAAYGASPEAAWHITETQYDSRVRNVEELLPVFKTLDYPMKERLLESLANLSVTNPTAAQNLHKYWWREKHKSSWNEAERNRYSDLDPSFNPQDLARSLLASLALR
ncbi:MAG: hypothetical protein R3A80_10630 [Bdellovibrionota bacterium]